LDRQQRVHECHAIGDVKRDDERRSATRRAARRHHGVNHDLVTSAIDEMAVAIDYAAQEQPGMGADVRRPHELPAAAPAATRALRQRHGQLTNRNLSDIEAQGRSAPSRHHQVGGEPIGKRDRKGKRAQQS
jgi:hypothetical protein